MLRPIVTGAFERLAAAVQITGAVPNGKVGNAGPVVLRAIGEHGAAIGVLQDCGSVVANLVEANYYVGIKPAEIAVWLDPATTGNDIVAARTIASRCEGNRFAALLAAGAVLTLNDADTVGELVSRAAEHAARPAPVVPLTSRQAALAKAWNARTPVPTA